MLGRAEPNLVEGIIRNNSVKSFWTQTSVSGDVLSRAQARVQLSRTIYTILVEGIMGNIHVKLL